MTLTLPSERNAILAKLPPFALVAAPAVWLTGWTVMRLGGSKGPGLRWTTAHSVWIAAFALFAVVAYALFRLADARADDSGQGRGWPALAVVVALAEAAALVVQMVIDLVVGLRAADKPAMSELFDEVFAVPGVDLAFYVVGPALLFIGILALAVVAAVRRTVSPWQAALVTLAMVLIVVGKPMPGALRLIEGSGMVCLWLALAPLARRF